MMGRFASTGLTMAVLLASGALKGAEIAADGGNAVPAFDVVQAKIVNQQHWLTFRMTLAGTAGKDRPPAVGTLGGAHVYSYVWPTKLDTHRVGFGTEKGILAFTVTSHPDFDDTPLFDENGDGNPDNDGRTWHSHWVVLVPSEEKCAGDLKVKDIPDGAQPELPATWPGLPIYIDSPGYDPRFKNGEITVRVPFEAAPKLKGVAFDGVTAGLRVHENVHAPLLCVEDVFDVASGDLSFPGKVE